MSIWSALALLAATQSSSAAAASESPTHLYCNVGNVDKETYNKPGVQIRLIPPFRSFALSFPEREGTDNKYSDLSLIDPDGIFDGIKFQKLEIESDGEKISAIAQGESHGIMIVGRRDGSLAANYLVMMPYFQPAGGKLKLPSALMGYCEFLGVVDVNDLFQSRSNSLEGDRK